MEKWSPSSKRTMKPTSAICVCSMKEHAWIFPVPTGTGLTVERDILNQHNYNMETMNVIEKSPSIDILEMEVASLENLVYRRQRWLESPANKSKKTYPETASDTRRLRDELEDKRALLAELKSEKEEAIS